VADNSGMLRRARRQDGRIKRQRAAEVIVVMESTGEPISFPAVARGAGVSVSLLYADTELAGHIATARERQRQAGRDRAWQLPARSLVTVQSLRTELANAKEQVRRLSQEATLLRERLARQLGADADVAHGRALAPILDKLEQRAAELEAENHRQRERIAQLEADGHELAETLEAARAMNRDLMGALNRRSNSDRGRRAARKTDR
jgi:hypothetical protein